MGTNMNNLPTWIDRQIESALSLYVAPYGYQVTEYTVEEIGNSLYVTRRYSLPNAPSFYHYEGYSIGPRGGRKLRFHSEPY
jgi:hypothetical protein